MTHESSYSKGCFIRKPKHSSDPFRCFEDESWNQAFNEVWCYIEQKLKIHQDEISYQLMNGFVEFTKKELTNDKIPTAVLLTGVNLPDHSSLFSQLINALKKNAKAHTAVLYPSSSCSVKHTVEMMASQYINNESVKIADDLMEDESDEESSGKAFAKSACNMPNLVKWYQNISSKKKGSNDKSKLVIIIPDLEGMNPKVLHDFLLILSNYIDKLPLVIVFGVATTSSVIGDMLEHSVTSKLHFEIFQSQRSIHILDNVLDKIILTKDCPFQLGSKLLKFLTDTFLFYDFSVQKFTLGIKFCVMDHFLQQPYKILCTSPDKLKSSLKTLSSKELDELRQLESFVKYISSLDESERDKLSTPSHFKKTVEILLSNCHKRLEHFYLFLKLLQILIKQLPGAPLGKQLRDLYIVAMSGEINKSAGYRDAVKLLKFQGMTQLIDSLDQMITFMDDNNYKGDVRDQLIQFKKDLSIDPAASNSEEAQSTPGEMTVVKSRAQFKEIMVSSLKKMKIGNSFEYVREKLITYLMEEMFPKQLEPVTCLPLNEIIVCETTKSHNYKRHLVGCQRGDVHHALTHPKDYLICDCCNIDDPNEIPPTLPDICIAYKLHLECGALINLHDWLQSFVSIIDPDSARSENMEINPIMQARFMQAVSDLEFMGFVKSSKRKADHVARMTWGGTAS